MAMQRSLILVLLISGCFYSEAGWLAAGGTYYSCMGACCSGAAAGGLMASVMTFGLGGVFGAAACASVCSSLAAGQAVFVPGLCFADNTTVLRKTAHGTEAVPVEEVKASDLLLTAANGQETFTKVLSNQRVYGNTSFVQAIVQTGAATYQISITEAHLMLKAHALHGVSNITAGSSGWNLQVMPAGLLEIGDVLPVHVGHVIEFGRLVMATKAVGTVRHSLETESGSVLADGVLTTTGCSEHASPTSWPVLAPMLV